MIRDIFSITTQLIAWLIVAPIYLLYFKVSVKNSKNLKGLRGPLIIATNHVNWHDAFFIRYVVGFWTPMLPLSNMAAKRFYNPVTQFFYNIGIIPLVYFLLGTFTVEAGKGIENNLINARKILRKGGVVVIFPEGKMNKTEELLPFKKGVAVLAIEENVPVLPMYIGQRYNFDEAWKELDVNIGTKFLLDGEKDVLVGAQIVRDVVSNLKN